MLQNHNSEFGARKYHQFVCRIPANFCEGGVNGCKDNADCERVMSRILALRRGPIRYPRNKIIAFEEDPTDYAFFVVKGIVRTCKTFRDGSRSVVGFHVPGEFFGLNGDLQYPLSAEAVTETTVLFFKRAALIGLAACDSQVARLILAHTAYELGRVQQHSLLIGRTAKSRVAAFLIELSTRMGQEKHIELLMPHRDIADFLGLKIETLSRVITELERSGCVARSSIRKVVLHDRASLVRLVT